MPRKPGVERSGDELPGAVDSRRSCGGFYACYADVPDGHHRGGSRRIGAERSSKRFAYSYRLAGSKCHSGHAKSISDLGSEMLKSRVLACLLTLSAIAAAPAAISQTAPDYAAIILLPTEATRIASSTPTARRQSGSRSLARSPV